MGRLKCMEVYKVNNTGGSIDYEEYKARLRDRRGTCGKLSDAIISCNSPSVLASDLDESLNEYLMFHGTNPQAAKGIIATDFRLPKDSSTHGAVYGPGIYVAETNTKATCTVHPMTLDG